MQTEPNDVVKTVHPFANLENEPYHFQLSNAVDAILEARLLGYPLDFEWIETQRDNLSRVLDKMKVEV